MRILHRSCEALCIILMMIGTVKLIGICDTATKNIEPADPGTVLLPGLLVAVGSVGYVLLRLISRPDARSG
jgi:hypothetical protein